MMDTICIRCKDAEIVLSREEVKMSPVLYGAEGGVIELPNISSDVQFIIDYITFYLDRPEYPEPSYPLCDQSELSAKVVNEEEYVLFENIIKYIMIDEDMFDLSIRLVELARRLRLQVLQNKLAAIIAYGFREDNRDT